MRAERKTGSFAQARGLDKQALLDILKMIGQALPKMLGAWCEVVVHDLADLDHSIVWIAGNVSTSAGDHKERGASLRSTPLSFKFTAMRAKAQGERSTPTAMLWGRGS